jgi:hypothetical protein
MSTDIDQVARAWAYTYEIYRWHYLTSGPVGFGQRAPVARPNMPKPSGFGKPPDELLGPVHMECTKFLKAHKEERGSGNLGWLGELEYAICALASLHDATPENLPESLKYCAWQAIESTRAHRSLITGAAALALSYFEENFSNPSGSNHVVCDQLGDTPISDERSELQIVSGEYPRYTYQVTVERPFNEVCDVIKSSEHWKQDKCGRLLSLGPSVDGKMQEAKNLRFIFPVRVLPNGDDWADWAGQSVPASYATDLSSNDSTMRLDFSLNKPKNENDANDALLVEDSGYFLVRKSLAKVGRSDLIVQRTLWFSGRAFAMNAALRPLFKMVVDHRVLREFAEICTKQDEPHPHPEAKRHATLPSPPPPPDDTPVHSGVRATREEKLVAGRRT